MSPCCPPCSKNKSSRSRRTLQAEVAAKQAQSQDEVLAWEKEIKEKLAELQKSSAKDVKNEKLCSKGGGGLIRRQSAKEIEDKASEDLNSETPKRPKRPSKLMDSATTKAPRLQFYCLCSPASRVLLHCHCSVGHKWHLARWFGSVAAHGRLGHPEGSLRQHPQQSIAVGSQCRWPHLGHGRLLARGSEEVLCLGRGPEALLGCLQNGWHCASVSDSTLLDFVAPVLACGVEASLFRPPEASVKDFLEGVRDGWNAGAMGSKALEVTNTMSWMGRQSAKRLLRDVSSDLVPCPSGRSPFLESRSFSIRLVS